MINISNVDQKETMLPVLQLTHRKLGALESGRGSNLHRFPKYNVH